MNISDICRTCLDFNITMKPLFNENAAVVCVDSVTIVDLLRNNCEILITRDDSYPQQICMKCMAEIQSAYFFKLKCKESETKLRQFKADFDKKCNENNSLQPLERVLSIRDNGNTNSNLLEELQEIFAYNSNDGIKKEEMKISDITDENPDEEILFQTFTSTINHVNQTISEEDSEEIEHVEPHPTDSENFQINGGKRIFECTVCTRVCDSNARLKEHMRVHTKEKPYKCETCFKEFRRKDILDNHLISHSDDRPHECSICSKKFKRKDTLTKHIKIAHSDAAPTPQNNQVEFSNNEQQRKYKCEICLKGFDHARNLYQHKRIHSEKKRFKCDVCSKCFAWKKCLTTHMRTHDNERPFKCPICPARFKQKPNLQKHITDLHSTKPIGSENTEDDDDGCDEEERPFKCKRCRASFKLIAGLTKHKKKFHRKLIVIKLRKKTRK